MIQSDISNDTLNIDTEIETLVTYETTTPTNYDTLKNKPSINGFTLEGRDMSFEELGEETITNSELKDIIDKMFDAVVND
jgi:hypothetical protein